MTTSPPSFGAAIVGPSFEWSWIDENDEPRTRSFRAHASITFEESLEYRSLQASMITAAATQTGRLKALGERLTEEEAQGRPMGDIQAELDESTRQTEQHERDRWDKIISQTLLLVHPPHREDLRPLLEAGSPTQVYNLRQWLAEQVFPKIEREVEATAAVDPTLPPPPPSSASDTTGGDGSDATESSSTD